MAVKNSGTSLSFKDDIEKEFGENDTRSLGGYQVQSGGSNLIEGYSNGDLVEGGLIDFTKLLERKNSTHLDIVYFNQGDIERHQAVKEVLQVYGDE